MGNNLFDRAMAAGKAGSEYKADITDANISKEEMSFTSRITAQKQQESSNMFEALSTGVELMSTLHGSLQDKQDFKQDIKNVESKYGTLQKDSRGFGQKLWDSVTGKSKQYTFADDKTGKTHTFSKTGVTTQGTILSGGSAELSSGGVEGVISQTAKEEHAKEEKVKSKIEKKDDGKHYGKKKGFDLGDLWGDNSMTGLGKKKEEKITLAKESNLSETEQKKTKKDKIEKTIKQGPTKDNTESVKKDYVSTDGKGLTKEANAQLKQIMGDDFKQKTAEGETTEQWRRRRIDAYENWLSEKKKDALAQEQKATHKQEVTRIQESSQKV